MLSIYYVIFHKFTHQVYDFAVEGSMLNRLLHIFILHAFWCENPQRVLQITSSLLLSHFSLVCQINTRCLRGQL